MITRARINATISHKRFSTRKTKNSSVQSVLKKTVSKTISSNVSSLLAFKTASYNVVALLSGTRRITLMVSFVLNKGHHVQHNVDAHIPAKRQKTHTLTARLKKSHQPPTTVDAYLSGSKRTQTRLDVVIKNNNRHTISMSAEGLLKTNPHVILNALIKKRATKSSSVDTVIINGVRRQITNSVDIIAL